MAPSTRLSRDTYPSVLRSGYQSTNPGDISIREPALSDGLNRSLEFPFSDKE